MLTKYSCVAKAWHYWFAGQELNDEDIKRRYRVVIDDVPLKRGDCVAHHGWLLVDAMSSRRTQFKNCVFFFSMLAQHSSSGASRGSTLRAGAV